MDSMTLLIKPSSSDCDLDCNYCFYKDVSKNREIYSNHFMNINTLKNLIKDSLSKNISTCNFMFQGGEPTLVGLDFYKDLIQLQNQFNINNVNITNSIQTNGFNLTEDFVKFFKNNNFLVGVSLDGPREIHNSNRVDYNNIGSFDKVINGIELLKKFEVNFNILCVVTNQTSKYIKDIYDFFKSKNFEYLQFIPCIKNFDYDNTSSNLNILFNDNPSYYLDGESYYTFLDTLFNIWYEDLKNGSFIEIRNFMDYINVLKGYNSTSCGMGGFCSLHSVVESNGDIYPCDFYCVDNWELGNINQSNLKDIQICDKAKSFFERSLYIHDRCKVCKYFKLCGGGCRRNLEPFINEIPSFNYQCSGLISFLDKNLNNIISICKLFY
ncbi:MAG: radical SAM protein [Romboutsia sp.]|uniref:radical SAM protein n=1 Tax=Romboutsia sp. TaxID=1965302 RepID=UPI003F3EEA7C